VSNRSVEQRMYDHEQRLARIEAYIRVVGILVTANTFFSAVDIVLRVLGH
jgi:hypothetical protein